MTKKERERRKENSFYNSELTRLQKNVVRAQYEVLFYKNGKDAADKMFFLNEWRHRYRGLALGEPEAKSYEKAKANLKKAVMKIKEHKKKLRNPKKLESWKRQNLKNKNEPTRVGRKTNLTK